MFRGCYWPKKEMVWWPELGLVHDGLKLGDALFVFGSELVDTL